jgi:hypothetical protein
LGPVLLGIACPWGITNSHINSLGESGDRLIWILELTSKAILWSVADDLVLCQMIWWSFWGDLLRVVSLCCGGIVVKFSWFLESIWLSFIFFLVPSACCFCAVPDDQV